MLYRIKDIEGFTVAATDGEVGTVRDAYFDDSRWVIRHLVVATGGWLSGRKVLISPHSITGIDRSGERLTASLTKQQIEGAPGIDADKPVSRQQEIPYYDYYGYPYYWPGPGLWGAAAYPLGGLAIDAQPHDDAVANEVAERRRAERESSDPHLRSRDAVKGYSIEATDGSIGHIEDFLFDDRTWAIRYAIVDTRNWLPGRRVLIEPHWIESVRWDERSAHVRLTRQAVKDSPEYDGRTPLSADDEQRVRSHYERTSGPLV